MVWQQQQSVSVKAWLLSSSRQSITHSQVEGYANSNPIRSLFALSVDRDILGGNFVWVVMIGVSILAAWVAQSLKRRN